MKSSRVKQTKEDKGSAYSCDVFSIDFTAQVDLWSFILLSLTQYFILNHGFPSNLSRDNNLGLFVFIMFSGI